MPEDLNLSILVDEISRQIACEFRRLGGRGRREDLLQDVWCELLAEWPRIARSYKPEVGPRDAFLRGLVRHTVIDHLRGRDRARLLPLSNERLEEIVDASSIGPGEDDESDAMQALTYTVLVLSSRVCAANREILERRILGEESPSRVAVSLKLTPRSVYKRTEKLKARLRTLVEGWIESHPDSDINHLLNRKSRGGGNR